MLHVVADALAAGVEGGLLVGGQRQLDDLLEAVAKKNEKAAKSKKNEKPGFFARTKKYFASVKSEMKRVTWPDKKELVNYSVVVCASLIVVGVVIALLDAGFGEALALFSGLRG